MPTAVAEPVAGVDFFVPHPNLGDEINLNICQSEIEGGAHLDDLPVGARLELETRHHRYTLDYGSTWGRSMLRLHYIGRGMRLEFRHPQLGVIRTSGIQEVRELGDPVC